MFEPQTEYRKLLSSKKLKDWLNTRFSVSRSFDMPFISGYSKSGKTVYLDKDIPLVLSIGGKKVGILPFVIRRERFEKAMIDLYDMAVQEANDLAEYAEQVELNALRVKVSTYRETMRQFHKSKLSDMRLPPDLDLTSYSADAALTERLRARMT